MEETELLSNADKVKLDEEERKNNTLDSATLKTKEEEES